MNLKFAEYILALDDARNVTHAAKKLGVSQGTLSNFLINHERDMDFQIFLRRHNTLIPTPNGKLYIDALQQMMSIKQHAYQRIHMLSGGMQETIRIGVSPSRGLNHLTDAYTEFVKLHPTVKLEVIEEYAQRLKEMIKDGEIDMFFGAITEEELTTSSLKIYCHTKIRLLAAVHKFLAENLGEASPNERFPTITCSQLQQLPVVLHGAKTATRYIQDKMFKEENFIPAVIAEGNNTNMVKSLVQKGLGVGFIPEHYVYEPDMDAVNAFYLKPEIFMYRCIAFPPNHEITLHEKNLADLMWLSETKSQEGFA